MPKSTPKTHVIELYCDSGTYSDHLEHEIVTGAEDGSALATLYGQNVRFIYADVYKHQKVIDASRNTGYEFKIINLYFPDDVDFLLSRINPGDSVLIHAQGDPEQGLIAGKNAEDFAEILLSEFELKDHKLENLDIYSCNMGRVEPFRNVLRERLTNFQTITTYTELCSVGLDEDGLVERVWLKTNEDGTIKQSYRENNVYEEGVRIIESTKPKSAKVEKLNRVHSTASPILFFEPNLKRQFPDIENYLANKKPKIDTVNDSVATNNSL